MSTPTAMTMSRTINFFTLSLSYRNRIAPQNKKARRAYHSV